MYVIAVHTLWIVHILTLSHGASVTLVFGGMGRRPT